MAKPKKGTLHQILVPMVDSTDFASIESAITESDFNSGATKKFWGWNTGVSTATTSGTISKTASLVRSGVFRIILKTTENNYDQMMVRVNKTGCAEQILTWSNVDNDDSDIMSMLTAISGIASDAHSAAAAGASRALVVQSRLSDFDSRLVSDVSDLASMLTALSDAVSNAYSAAAQGSSRTLLVQSRLSDLDSRLVSDVSDMLSMLTALSDAISDAHSDLGSKIGGITATVGASDISDIASAVWANTIGARVDSRVLLTQSMASDAASAAQQGNSRTLLVQSRLSDLDSRLVSDVSDIYSALVALSHAVSDAHSDLGSKIGGITASVSASDISDIASAVWADTIGARVDSRILLSQSRISDVQSYLVALSDQLSDAHSDLKSAIGNVSVTLTASDISDIASAVVANLPGVSASDISDIASAVWAHTVGTRVDSRVLVNQSRISDVYSAVVAGVPLDASTMSDLRSAITAGGLQLSDAISDVQVAADAAASRALLNQSRISDVQSYLVAISGALSDVESQIDAGVPLDASTLSDLRSAITAGGLQLSDALSVTQVNATAAASRALLNQSRISDVQSYLVGLSGALSDVESQLDAGSPLDASTMSDLRSAITAAGLALSDAVSDVQVAADAAASRALLVQSRVSDVQSYLVGMSGALSDVESQIDAGVPLDASSLSDLRSAITAGFDASDLSDIASAVWAYAGAEPAAVVSPTGSYGSKVDWLTALSRNKITQTATVQSLRNDGDSADIASAAVSDDGVTFTRGEFA